MCVNARDTAILNYASSVNNGARFTGGLQVNNKDVFVYKNNQSINKFVSDIILTQDYKSGHYHVTIDLATTVGTPLRALLGRGIFWSTKHVISFDGAFLIIQAPPHEIKIST